MSTFAAHAWCRVIGWLVIAALLLPTLVGCVTVQPEFIRLDGIVIGGTRVARPDVTGAVRVTRGNSRIEGRPGMKLELGDRVETASDAEAVIRFPSGTVLLMRPNSSGRIGSFLDTIGEIFVSVKGAFSVDTQFVKAGARGTAYLVRTEPGDVTSVTVFEGVVAIESTAAAWAPVQANAGTTVTAGRQPPRAALASEAELQRTRDWVERLQKNVPAQTTVSGVGLAAIAIGAIVGGILLSRDRDHDRRQPQIGPAGPAGQGGVEKRRTPP